MEPIPNERNQVEQAPNTKSPQESTSTDSSQRIFSGWSLIHSEFCSNTFPCNGVVSRVALIYHAEDEVIIRRSFGPNQKLSRRASTIVGQQ
jgi:hypothetical protein